MLYIFAYPYIWIWQSFRDMKQGMGIWIVFLNCSWPERPICWKYPPSPSIYYDQATLFNTPSPLTHARSCTLEAHSDRKLLLCYGGGHLSRGCCFHANCWCSLLWIKHIVISLKEITLLQHPCIHEREIAVTFFLFDRLSMLSLGPLGELPRRSHTLLHLLSSLFLWTDAYCGR